MVVTRSCIVPFLQNTPPEPLAPDDLILETERLRLRPRQLNDLDLALELFTDPEIMKYVSGTMTPQEIEDYMPVSVRRGAGGRIGVWCATPKNSNEKLGTCILLPLPIEEDDTDWSKVRPGSYPDAEIEVGYIFTKTAWGKGYATEVCRRLLKFAFEQTALSEVVATTDNDNAASQHVLRKCGLQHHGKRYAYAEDDCPDFRITREEWLTQEQA